MQKTAVVTTLLTGIFQLVIGLATHLFPFLAVHSLCLFNNLPMVLDAAVLNLEGENGDEKKRTLLVSKLLVPMSIGYAVGPYLAFMFFLKVTPLAYVALILSGCVSIFLICPLCYSVLPDTRTDRPFKVDLASYKLLLTNPRTRWCLLFLFMVCAPYIAYDSVVKISIANTMFHEEHIVHILFAILGVTTVCCNVFLLPYLQSRYGPQTLLMGAFTILFFSYVYLSVYHTATDLLLGMPFQLLGANIALGEVSSQLMGTIGKNHIGKGAALIRACQLLSAVLTPVIAGGYIDTEDTSRLSIFNCAVSLLAVPIVYRFGGFMRFNTAFLPVSGDKLS